MVYTCEALVTYSVVAKQGKNDSEYEKNQIVGDELRGKIREGLKSRNCVLYQEIETAFFAKFKLNQLTKGHLHELLSNFFEELKNEYDSNDQTEIYVVAMAKDLGLVKFSL